MRLLEGLDDIGLTLKHTDEIKAWEKRMAAAQPWLQTARDSRGSDSTVILRLRASEPRRVTARQCHPSRHALASTSG